MKDLIETLEEYANGFINVIAPQEEDVKELLEHIYNQDKEIERLKERENMMQERFRDWKKEIEKERKYWLCERTGCCGRIKDSKKYSSLYQENKRLNNIIEEARKYIEQEEISIIYQELGLQQINVKNELLDILKGSDKE